MFLLRGGLMILTFVCSLHMYAADSFSQPEESAAFVAQNISITGTVYDNTGTTLPGVNIQVKGTTTGTLSGSDGKFSITVANTNAVLIFSYIGYVAQEITVGSQRVIDVTMNEDTQLLEEVVVIGYGTVRKADLTGAIVSMSNEKFKNLPQGGVTQILQGKAAGVNITSTRGDGQTTIRIRGNTSLFKSSEPLWVVDGVIGGTVGNFYDIQSIEVLKDASSTAIYGSQGANGVILVTTKKPQDGAAKVTFDARYGWNTFRTKPDMLDAKEFATAWRSVKGESIMTNAQYDAYISGADPGINWFDTMTQTGFGQNYNLNITGGSPKTKYAITAWGGDSKGQIITVTSRSFNLKATLDIEIAPWLNIYGYVYGGKSNSHNGVGQDELTSIFENSPTMSLMDPSGDFYMGDPYVSLGQVNPYARKVASYSDSEGNNLSGFADIRIKFPIDGLTLSVQGLYSFSQSLYRALDLSTRGPGQANYAQQRSDQSNSYRNINNLTYQKQFGDHRLTVMGVMETSKSIWSRIGGETRNFTDEEYLGYWVLGSGTQNTLQGFSNSAMVSFFGRVMYSYKGKYSFTGTYRADAPSQFRDENKWGYFPSAGVSWNISEEDFFNKDLIQQLKLRASYGTAGNHGVGAYSALAYLSRDFAAYGTTTRYYGNWPATTPNPDIRWEKTTQFNVGFDLSMLDQRLSLIVDAYSKKTNDLLFLKNIPKYNGGGSVWVNQGAVENKGMEFTLNAYPIRTRDFIWESNFTAAYQQNKVTDLGGEDMIVPDSGRGSAFSGGVFALKVGYPQGTFLLSEFAGYDNAGNSQFVVQDGSGRLTIENNMDNKTFQDENSIPYWTYGWNNSLTWKNWDFNVFFRFTGNYYRLNMTRFFDTAVIGAKRFITSREGWYGSWDNVTDKSKATAPSHQSSNNQYVPNSTQWLENAQYLRCQNLSIGYQIPKNLTKFADIHLSLSAQNLFCLTNYKGLDPETVSEMSSDTYDTTFGIDRGSLPMPRSYSLIVRLNF